MQERQGFNIPPTKPPVSQGGWTDRGRQTRDWARGLQLHVCFLQSSGSLICPRERQIHTALLNPAITGYLRSIYLFSVQTASLRAHLLAFLQVPSHIREPCFWVRYQHELWDTLSGSGPISYLRAMFLSQVPAWAAGHSSWFWSCPFFPLCDFLSWWHSFSQMALMFKVLWPRGEQGGTNVLTPPHRTHPYLQLFLFFLIHIRASSIHFQCLYQYPIHILPGTRNSLSKRETSLLQHDIWN